MGKPELWKMLSVVVRNNTYHLLACRAPVRSYASALCQPYKAEVTERKDYYICKKMLK